MLSQGLRMISHTLANQVQLVDDPKVAFGRYVAWCHTAESSQGDSARVAKVTRDAYSARYGELIEELHSQRVQGVTIDD